VNGYDALRRAGEAGYGNCVIFRSDGDYNTQYLTSDGTWTVDRAEAARCLNSGEAKELANKYGVVFFGGMTGPTCDMACFRSPDEYDRLLAANFSEIDADDNLLTERFIQANLESALPNLKVNEILRRAKGTDA
jgi:hypothetical protein